MYHMGLWSSGCKINKLVKLVKLINHGLTTAFLSYRVTLHAWEMRDYLRDWTRPPFCFTVFQDNNFIQLKHVYLENSYFMLFKSVFVFNTSFRRNCPSSQFTHPSSQYTLLIISWNKDEHVSNIYQISKDINRISLSNFLQSFW